MIVPPCVEFANSKTLSTLETVDLHFPEKLAECLVEEDEVGGRIYSFTRLRDLGRSS